MNKNINPFTYYYPTKDIHGETTDTCVFVINDFINDNIKLGKENIIIIHGKGTGALKHKTHEILSKNKNVTKYYIDPFNEGCTIIELHIDKKC